MNIYQILNEITEYIDNHLDEKIEYLKLSKMMGVNEYTMRRIFSLLTNQSLSEYIRKRRLTTAGYDLYQNRNKIIDIAMKYQYDNATSFSRAFFKFHGIKPSEVNKNAQLKNFPRIIFNEDIKLPEGIEYKIKTLDEMIFYGIGVKVNNQNIGKIAPKFFQDSRKKYESTYGNIEYAMITYQQQDREQCNGYYILYQKKIKGFQKFIIPKGKWLFFRISSYDDKEIQKVSQQFYCEFLPSSKYNLRLSQELEYYHDGVTDFIVPIY
ncbi:MAG: helix-turn-helix domain-containing protein [Bacilli bacterium]|nr:helix-turn-helix domain-containing protein [Bacilli bacterium]